MADVASVEPTAAKGIGGLCGRFPVALHHLGATDDDLSIFAGRQFALTGLNVYDLLFGIADGHTDALQAVQRGITR